MSLLIVHASHTALQENARRLRAELAKANEEAIRRKAQKALEEAEADCEALRHLNEKAAAERARLAAIEAERKAKEKLWADMRAKQQRIIDKRGEEDERRAKHHEEAVILRDRERAKREREAREALMKYVPCMCVHACYNYASLTPQPRCRQVAHERDIQLELKKRRAEEEKVAEQRLLEEIREREMAQLRRESEKRAAKKANIAAVKTELEHEIDVRAVERRRTVAKKHEDRLAMQREEMRRGELTPCCSCNAYLHACRSAQSLALYPIPVLQLAFWKKRNSVKWSSCVEMVSLKQH